MNREEEEIVKTTKLSLAREIINLPLPHQQLYKGVYRNEWSMYLFPLKIDTNLETIKYMQNQKQKV